MTQKRFDVEGWPLQPELCRCDEWFIEYLIALKPTQRLGPVFHMGPGLHHRVGRYCSDNGMQCVSYTVSEEEEFAKPDLFGYEVKLADIYDLYKDKWPFKFQFMTLFHLGELVDRFGPIQRIAMAVAVTAHVQYNGLVFFYQGSSAWDRCLPEFVQPSVEAGLLSPMGGYKDLRIYRKSM